MSFCLLLVWGGGGANVVRGSFGRALGRGLRRCAFAGCRLASASIPVTLGRRALGLRLGKRCHQFGLRVASRIGRSVTISSLTERDHPQQDGTRRRDRPAFAASLQTPTTRWVLAPCGLAANISRDFHPSAPVKTLGTGCGSEADGTTKKRDLSPGVQPPLKQRLTQFR